MATGPTINRGASKQDYRTPTAFLDALKHRLGIDGFTIDLAASEENKVAPLWYDTTTNALLPEHPWTVDGKGWSFCNPPYADITPWVEKAFFEMMDEGANVAMLVPASVGSNWWANWVHNVAHTLFLNGRITFEGATDPYPRDLAILLYSPMMNGSYGIWRWSEELK